MEKVFIKSKFNRKLYTKFFYFNLLQKSASIYFFFLAALLSLYLAINVTVNPDADNTSTTIYWLFALFLLSGLPAFTYGRISATVKKIEKELGDKLEIIEISKPKIVRFVEGVQGKVVLGWENFDSVYEYKDYIFMYIDRDRGLVFTKDSILDGDLETFRKLAMNNLRPGKKERSDILRDLRKKNND